MLQMEKLEDLNKHKTCKTISNSKFPNSTAILGEISQYSEEDFR